HSFEPPAATLDDIAMGDPDIGREVAVGAGLRVVLLALETRARGTMRAFGIDRRAGRLLEPRGVRRMVAVGVGDEDMAHRLAADSIEQRSRMRLVVRTGIDDRDVALADDVAD